MDSLSQAVLGASVAGVCAPAGHRGKAMITGAILGSLPDLDVVIDYDDPVKNFTFHRGFSHSLFVLAPFSICLWLLLRLLWKPVREAPGHWLAAISLALLTHPLLDAHTAYGTQLFWPLESPPVMWATIFIIDPLYTLPLLVGVIAAIVWLGEARGCRALQAGLALSTLYLAWTWVGQAIVRHNVLDSLATLEYEATNVFITPTPLNSLLWRLVILTPNGYYEGFDSLVVKEPRIDLRHYSSDHAALNAAESVWAVGRLRWFTHDFLKAYVEQDRLYLSDLRMGQEPDYVFTHGVAARSNPHWIEIPPERIPVSFTDRALSETWRRIWRE